MNENGFTLMEVIVSVAILMLVSEMMILSVSIAARMNQRADRVRKAGSEMGRRILSESGSTEGRVSLEFDEYQIDTKGYLYTKDAGHGILVQVIWVDEKTTEKIATDNDADAGLIEERGRE